MLKNCLREDGYNQDLQEKWFTFGHLRVWHWTMLLGLLIIKGKNDVLKWKGVTERLCSIVGWRRNQGWTLFSSEVSGEVLMCYDQCKWVKETFPPRTINCMSDNFYFLYMFSDCIYQDVICSFSNEFPSLCVYRLWGRSTISASTCCLPYSLGLRKEYSQLLLAIWGAACPPDSPSCFEGPSPSSLQLTVRLLQVVDMKCHQALPMLPF